LINVTRSGGAISPDGHWLAYTTGTSDAPQVFVRPFANGKIAGSALWPIAAADGTYPVWSRAPGARQLLYVTSEGGIMVVDYTVEGDSFHNSKPRRGSTNRLGRSWGLGE
jgi:Tol biopolymer transport system component